MPNATDLRRRAAARRVRQQPACRYPAFAAAPCSAPFSCAFERTQCNRGSLLGGKHGECGSHTCWLASNFHLMKSCVDQRFALHGRQSKQKLDTAAKFPVFFCRQHQRREGVGGALITANRRKDGRYPFHITPNATGLQRRAAARRVRQQPAFRWSASAAAAG